MLRLSRVFVHGILAIAFLALLVMAVLGMLVEPKESKFERIKIGDSRQSVISIMGKPDEQLPCDISIGTNDSTDVKRRKEQCAEMLGYTAFRMYTNSILIETATC